MDRFIYRNIVVIWKGTENYCISWWGCCCKWIINYL